MRKSRNILFIMCDQLRFDYLSCAGHPSLNTPNIDALAARGVRFTNAYCQAPLCSPSRASFYTGRYLSSHGVSGNVDTTGLGEMMLADYLNPLGYRCAVVGKTDSRKSREDLRRVGADLQSAYARASASGGFEPYEPHEGAVDEPNVLEYPKHVGYNAYLKSRGYESADPWEDYANSGVDESGNRHSGWHLRNSVYPAAIDESESETAFSTRRAMAFMSETGDRPWCLHLSYIKPHWPIIAPDPYHRLYTKDDVIAVNRDEIERSNPHSVVDAFMQEEYSQTYSRDEARETVLPVYMGLIKQIDDHLGNLFEFMDASGLLETTMIVFTADHGDYLGDHWLGEKDLFHDPSIKIPFIVVDPSADADATRGKQCDAFVESVDVVPTILQYAGGPFCRERLEGRSLGPLLHGTPDRPWRSHIICELDYSDRGPRQTLGLDPYQCRATVVRDADWKYVRHHLFDAQLFNLKDDPDEFIDLGRDEGYEAVRADMEERIVEFQRSLKRRTGIDYDMMSGICPAQLREIGYFIGQW